VGVVATWACLHAAASQHIQKPPGKPFRATDFLHSLSERSRRAGHDRQRIHSLRLNSSKSLGVRGLGEIPSGFGGLSTTSDAPLIHHRSL
jgi:hypothetical protein